MPALHAFAACASTNDVARALALDGAAHGTTVLADHQTAGRGRQGRAWADRPGASLLLSMVLRPRARAEPAATALPLLVGLACARALRAATPLDVRIEWPNDLVVDDRKIGGILCEAALAAGALDFVVAGVGLNLAALPDTLDDATRARAGSIADALRDAPPARAHLGAAIARALLALSADASLDGGALDELRRLDSLAGRAVRFGTGREGIARGILPDGALVVDCGGDRVEVRSGSVSPLPVRSA